MDLLATNDKDSLLVKNTAGVFYPSTLIFHGKNGTVDWSRVGLDPDEVYAEIPLFTITLKSPSIDAENTVYYNKKYFSAPLLGKLEEKAVTTTVTPDNATYPRLHPIISLSILKIYENVDSRRYLCKGKSFIGQGSVVLAQIHFKRRKKIISTKSISFY